MTEQMNSVQMKIYTKKKINSENQLNEWFDHQIWTFKISKQTQKRKTKFFAFRLSLNLKMCEIPQWTKSVFFFIWTIFWQNAIRKMIRNFHLYIDVLKLKQPHPKATEERRKKNDINQLFHFFGCETISHLPFSFLFPCFCFKI